MKNRLKRKLQIRFVLLSMAFFLLIQGVIVGISIYRNHRELAEKSDMLIAQLHNNSSVGSRYFSVKIPAGKDTVYPDTVQHLTVSAEMARDFTQRALAQEKERGFLDGYRYRIYKNENGTKIYFLLRESGIEMCKAAGENMILVSLIGLASMGVLLIPVSARVVKPLVENHTKQKEFITFAGHELKTPLTVISTNIQLLESEVGKNDWIDGIQKQIAHLTEMIQNMVFLSKAEEYQNPLQRESFDLAKVILEVTESFRSLAIQNKIRLENAFEESLPYQGCEAEIRHLLQILMDNAFRYATEEGFIRAEAKKGFHGIHLTLTNSAPPISREEAELLLRRFHRGKNAEGKPGFGLGLSIARAIAERHNGHLQLSTDTKGEFRVEVVLH